MKIATGIVNYVLTSFLIAGSLALVHPSDAYASQSHGRHAGKRPVLTGKDQEIASLKAQVKELQADLARAQARIDSLEMPAVAQQAAQTAPTPTMPNAVFSNIVAQRFANGDVHGDPIWVVTFEIKNNDKFD